MNLVGRTNAVAIKLDGGGIITNARKVSFLTPGGEVRIYGTAVDAAGHTYITGYFVGATITLGDITLTNLGVQDIFAAKLDPTGTVIWAKNFGGHNAHAGVSDIAVDMSNNVYLAGYFQYSNLTQPALAQIGAQDAFALKLDSLGNPVWAKNFGGFFAHASGNGIAVDAANHVYLGGSFQYGDLTVPTLPRLGNGDGFAIKLDGDGNRVWAKNYGGSGAITGISDIAIDALNNIFLSGSFRDSSLTAPALSIIGSMDAFAMKLDSDGNTNWAKNFGGNGANVAGNGIAVDAANNVYLGGQFDGANLTTPPLNKVGTGDAFALKLDSTGNNIWARNFGGSGAFTTGRGIALDMNGNTYLAGYFTNANLSAPALPSIGNFDAFALKLDNAGNYIWAKNFGGFGARAFATSIAVDSENNVHLSGDFAGANLTIPALAEVGGNAFIVKVNASLAGVKSRKTHASAGAFDIALDTFQPITGAVTVEPRATSSGHTIVFQFDSAVTSPGTVSVIPVGSATLSHSGNEVLVNLTGVPDHQRVTVTLSNVNGAINPSPVSVGFLAGDVNSSRAVNAGDIMAVKARSTQTTNASNFRFDVNASGSINAQDISAVKARSGTVLTP